MQQDSPADAGQQYPAVTDRRYSTADERSRGRKGAEGRIRPRNHVGTTPPARSGLRALPILCAFGQIWRAAILAAGLL